MKSKLIFTQLQQLLGIKLIIYILSASVRATVTTPRHPIVQHIWRIICHKTSHYPITKVNYYQRPPGKTTFTHTSKSMGMAITLQCTQFTLQATGIPHWIDVNMI